MIFSLLIAIQAQALLRDPGSEPGRYLLCKRTEMNSCIENHRAARQNEISAIGGIDEKLRLLARDRGAIEREILALSSEMRKASVTAEMADWEGKEAVALSTGDPIFPAGPRAEEIFFLRGEPNSWGELHPAERRARLSALVNSSRERLSLQQPLHQKLAIEIQALDVLNASLMQERAQRGQQVNVHAEMCERGCKIEFCRDG